MFHRTVQLTIIAGLCFSAISNAQPEHVHHHHKRSSQTCSFPSDDGLVAVTKDKTNGGWALHSDTACTAGNYCPYACPPGKLMAQWDPDATSYSYPESQYGGLYCNDDGTVSKPYSDKDYCYDGKGTVKVDNKAGSDVAFCQTVLPGNEEMLIPTNAGSGDLTTLAVPGTEYWASTAAHYYVNPPGVSTDDACVWGSTSNPYGNWSPYVAGANMDDNKNTFVKIGWNPEYLDAFSSKTPSFGIRITCDDESKCNGLKCEIDPSSGVGEVSGSSVSTGSGSAKYCVVTAEQGATAKIEVFSSGSSSNKKRQLFDDEVVVAKRDNTTSTSSTNSSAAPSITATSGAGHVIANSYAPVVVALLVSSWCISQL